MCEAVERVGGAFKLHRCEFIVGHDHRAQFDPERSALDRAEGIENPTDGFHDVVPEGA